MTSRPVAARPVAIVTGASRGAGRGIAIALGSHGYAVYVTGRTQQEGTGVLPGTIHETAERVSEAGGEGIAVAVDHSDDRAIKALIDRVAAERQGRLDILVNNVAAVHDDLIKPGPFWEKSIGLGDILDVGLRSQYIATYYAAPLFADQRNGLVVMTSSYGSACYMHGAAYGAQKAGVDKMAWDMAHDFKPYGVACVSIWMGLLLTARTRQTMELKPEYKRLIGIAETPEFTGHIIQALAQDPELMDLTGQTFIGAELALRYGLTDEGGRQPPSRRRHLGSPHVWHQATVE